MQEVKAVGEIVDAMENFIKNNLGVVSYTQKCLDFAPGSILWDYSWQYSSARIETRLDEFKSSALLLY